MNIHEEFRSAHSSFQKGNFEQAVAFCKNILTAYPNNITALHFLGVIYLQINQYEEAIKHLRRALEISPESFEGFYNLGRAFEKKGMPDEAIENYQKVIQLNPNFIDAHINLGNIFHMQGRFGEAIRYYRKILDQIPDNAEIYQNLGIALHDQGQINEALACYQKVLRLRPDAVDALNNIGFILKEKNQFHNAIGFFQKALQFNPEHIEVLNNLANAYQANSQIDDALKYYQKAVQLQPDHAESHAGFGTALYENAQFENAIVHYQKAIQLKPDYVDPHFNNALALLLLGKFREGWKEYEWRRKTKDFIALCPQFTQPIWSGKDSPDSVILIYAEQGFGDTLQFIRYAPLVVQHGATIVFECQKELKPLLQTIEGIHHVFSQGEPLPEFDIQSPLLSLPLAFNTTLETIPAKVPYIKADVSLTEQWSKKIRRKNLKFNIGLVWSGNPKYGRDRYRSLSLQSFSCFTQIEYACFYSLQKGSAAEQAKNPPSGMNLIDLTEDIHDFSDTAAFIENLNLIISVDTAVAHLAGAMGKPVWTLIPFIPDWRWMLHRTDSPWYPTMKLFRQSSPDTWDDVISKIYHELQSLV